MKKRGFKLILALSSVLLATLSVSETKPPSTAPWGTNRGPTAAEALGASELPPLASCLHVLPPLGTKAANSSAFDDSLTGYLRVTVCEFTNEGCQTVAEFTSQKTQGRPDYIQLRGVQYQVNWPTGRGDMGKLFRIQFSVAGLEIGFIDFSLRPTGMVPIRFQIDRHPRIRARVMHEQGFDATEIAARLASEFDLTPEDAAQILTAEGFSQMEIARAIIFGFKMDAWEAAAFLKNFGYPAKVTYDVLMEIFDIQSEILIENILSAAGYLPEEFLDFTALGSVRKFAPVLMFDGSHQGLPLSAQAYFENVLSPAVDPQQGTIAWTTPWNGPGYWYELGPVRIWVCNPSPVSLICSRDECNCGMQNNDFSTLTGGSVPTYYKVISDSSGRIRIAYWWFYGFQPPCSYTDLCPGQDGAHHGDWEHILVTTDPARSRADYVTFAFHGAWYTRTAGSFGVDSETGLRPMVYVGKLGHGNYHDQTKSGWMAGTPHHCCEYADYRNPHSDTVWWNTYANLVSLRGNSEPWMLADQIGSLYEYEGTEYEITAWRWGPHISYCDFWFIDCWNWEHNTAPMTHPTIDFSCSPALSWTTGSCSGAGCGTEYCEGLLYQAGGIYLNQGWPWDY